MMQVADLITACSMYANLIRHNYVTYVQTPQDFERILNNAKATHSKVITVYVMTNIINFTNKGEMIRHEACKIGKTIHLGLEDMNISHPNLACWYRENDTNAMRGYDDEMNALINHEETIRLTADKLLLDMDKKYFTLCRSLILNDLKEEIQCQAAITALFHTSCMRSFEINRKQFSVLDCKPSSVYDCMISSVTKSMQSVIAKKFQTVLETTIYM